MNHNWITIKTLIYLILGVFLLIFHSEVLPYIPYIVAGVMFLTAAEGIIICAVDKTCLSPTSLFLDYIMTFVIGIVLLLSTTVKEYCYIIWGVWSVIAQADEIKEGVLEEYKVSKPIAITNLVKSIVVVGFSIFLILDPGDAHAVAHIILLGVELIVTVIFDATKHVMDRVEYRVAKLKVVGHDINEKIEGHIEHIEEDIKKKKQTKESDIGKDTQKE